jgi:2-succinyl-5-enolpyruvyl-6-hydroxy-3-cyclohexene-1-carboxylate synthase
MLEAQRSLGLFVTAFVDELTRAGVHHFCVCPGSRSTPLALAIARHPDIRLWMHLDERSAAFFGLGLARAGRQPVALLCTSGTAAANFLPAVVEAAQARVPLVVLTADRPRELRDCGAPQTIDQVQLYGSQVKWFFDLEEPLGEPELIRHARVVACRAVATARQGPPGPVQVNLPFREPLVPRRPEAWPPGSEPRPGGRPYVQVEPARRAPAGAQVARLADELRPAGRGLIVCGPQDDPTLAPAVTALAERLGYPILADPLSGLRRGKYRGRLVLDSYDAFLRDQEFVDQNGPELVLRFGAMPTSKPVLLFLQRHVASRQIVVDGDGGWLDPTLLATDLVQADGPALCSALVEALGDPTSAPPERAAWQAAWLRADHLTRAILQEALGECDELFEGRVFAELDELLPAGATLFAGNSMPVRDLDTFFSGRRAAVHLLGNRGAAGIDGVVSSALGASAAQAGPLVLVIGDLSFYHDSNGLLAARRHGLDLTVILLNNDGGGIFSFLPQADEPEQFETLFGTPHGLDFRPLAETYGARYSRVTDWDGFRAATRAGLAGGGLHVVEVPTERQRNVELHRRLWPRVAAALAAERAPAG